MRLVRATKSGELRPLPELKHPSGRLDGLWWIDGEGKALARFGTHGSYYRPSHEDKAPALAFVDAGWGRTLDTLLLRDLPGEAGKRREAVHLRGIATTVLPDGRLRALLRFDQWIVWTEGERPRALTDPYPRLHNVDLAFTPDGSRVLVSLPLPTTTMCPRLPPCLEGPVVEGPVAALHDLRTGAQLWTVRGQDQHGGSRARPVVSPDGRYGFVPLPAMNGRQQFVVVSMKNGRVLQRVGTTADSRTAFGFTCDRRTLWVSGNFGVTAFYKIGGR